MIEWFRSLPKAMFVTVVLAAGILFIVLSDPPRTICDSQIEAFKTDAKEFLSLDPIKKPNRKETRFAKLLETCKVTNSAGGCYELFFSLKQMIKDSRAVSPECYGKLANYADFSTAVWQSLDVMIQLAWGPKAPATMALKAGWFDPADLHLFCELKRVTHNVYSESRWNSFVEEYFKKLPGGSGLSRAEAWQRMLPSVNCAAYM